MELKLKGFKVICKNCGSEDVTIYEDKEKEELTVICEECENHSGQNSDAFKQIKQILKESKEELKEQALRQLILLSNELLEHEYEDLEFIKKTYKENKFIDLGKGWLEFLNSEGEYYRYTLTDEGVLEEEIY